MSTVLDTPHAINMFRLHTLKAGIKLELVGLRISRGPSCTARAKAEFGFKGSKAKVLAQLEKLIADINAAVERGDAVVV